MSGFVYEKYILLTEKILKHEMEHTLSLNFHKERLNNEIDKKFILMSQIGSKVQNDVKKYYFIYVLYSHLFCHF